MAECVDLLEQGESSRPYIPRMSRPMFMHIVNDIISYPSRNPGPVPLRFKRMQDKQLDARGKPGFSTIQKCVCTIRQLAYGYNPDSLDEYLQMGEETARWMNTCVDQHQRTYNACTLDMKSFMASQACLEALIACTGLRRTVPRHGKSPLFRKIIEDRAPDSPFTVNGTHYKKGYYLADDIYPVVKSYSCPLDEKRKKFKKFQESARKDVERAIGGLQNSWHILTQPARSKSVNRITRTMYACVILHNMKVEDAGYAISSLEDGDDIDPIVLPERTFEERIAFHQRTGKEL
uniref:uncharacterized protein LOC122610258 n=1 Tax=Erigeron canadensis TaxID=72917 RepID=UPI001CB9817E|nr:uncharacterized protein LOC122610258 [Erigeron canadensis]